VERRLVVKADVEAKHFVGTVAQEEEIVAGQPDVPGIGRYDEVPAAPRHSGVAAPGSGKLHQLLVIEHEGIVVLASLGLVERDVYGHAAVVVRINVIALVNGLKGKIEFCHNNLK